MADPARTDFSVDLVRTEPGICVVTVSGALDISTEGRVRAFLAAAIATPGTALVVVDVDRVTFVGVSGLRAVLDADGIIAFTDNLPPGMKSSMQRDAEAGRPTELDALGGAVGASRAAVIRDVVIPSALPNILLGVRLSLGVAWLGLVVAELLGSTNGIGFLINAAKQNGTTEIIFAGIVIFAIVGKLLDSFVRLLERRLLHWRDSYHG